MNTIFVVLVSVLVIALAVTMFRVARGPSLPVRVVALDLMSTLAVGLIAIYAVAVRQPIFLDVAVVLGLISFLGTVAFAYFIEKGEFPWPRA
ncbi:MAG: cation:proton antiporter [Anaerolineales bacterium]|nr:cation:proton antiporter [Anaerolineales bacterium]